MGEGPFELENGAASTSQERLTYEEGIKAEKAVVTDEGQGIWGLELSFI